jgi:hypothetical protein
VFVPVAHVVSQADVVEQVPVEVTYVLLIVSYFVNVEVTYVSHVVSYFVNINV